MTHPLIQAVRRGLQERADPGRAAPMQAYMKSDMPYLGVSAPAQRLLWRQLFSAEPLSSASEWRTVVLTLWRDARVREERYAAIALADGKSYAGFRTREALPMLEEMIVSGAWWDFVDALATHHLGDVLRAEQEAGRGAAMHRLLKEWARGANLWKRRAAILCQIRYKRDTNLKLLYACIEPSLQDAGAEAPAYTGGSKGTRPTTEAPAYTGGSKGTRPTSETTKTRPASKNTRPASEKTRAGDDVRRDFFIRKAIGWALRQYAWVDATEVRRYVALNRARLSPLSVREALKNM